MLSKLVVFGVAALARYPEGDVIDDNPLVVLYSDDWAGWGRTFFPSDIEKQILSRQMPVRNWVINYAFLSLNPEECRIHPVDHEMEFSKGDPNMYSAPPSWWTPDAWAADTYTAGYIPAMLSLKQKYPHMKIIPSVGGWSRSAAFHDCVHDKPDIVIQSTLDLVNTFDFDGIDFDWEYPNCDGPGAKCGCQNEPTCPSTSNVAGPGDWDAFMQMIRDLRTRFDELEERMQKRLYITAALGMNPSLIDGNNNIWSVPTPIETICDEDNFDWVNLMAYDFYGPWSKKTGPLAPLHATPDEIAKEDVQMNIEDSMDRILARCSRPEKLTLGLPTYGKIWRDVPKGDGPVPGMWQTSTAGVPSGTGTWELGTVSIWDIRGNYETNSQCTKTFDDYSQTASLYCKTNPKASGEQNIFVSYDDKQSWKSKMEYAKSKGMAGAIIWVASDIGTDKPDNVDELYGGLIEGWTGDSTPFPAPHSNGRTTFTNPLPFPNFPCPLPYSANVNSMSPAPDYCYDNIETSYDTQEPWRMSTGTNEVDNVGKDKVLIHPLGPAPVKSTTTTRKPTTTTTTRRPTTTTTTTRRTTTTTRRTTTTSSSTRTRVTSPRPTPTTTTTTRPTTTTTSRYTTTTTKKTSTTTTTTPRWTSSTATDAGDAVLQGCKDIMATVVEWSVACQGHCGTFENSPWCPSTPTVDALVACVQSQAPYCVPS